MDCFFQPTVRILNLCKNGLTTEGLRCIISRVSAVTPVSREDDMRRQAASAPVSRAGAAGHARGTNGSGSKSQPPALGLQSLLCSENKLNIIPDNIASLKLALRELQVH